MQHLLRDNDLDLLIQEVIEAAAIESCQNYNLPLY